MITLENRFFPVRSAVCFFVEGAIVLISVVASFSILAESGSTSLVSFDDAVVRGLLIAFICQTCMYFLDLYDLKHSQSWGEIVFSLVFAVGFVLIGIGIVSYSVPEMGVEGNAYYLAVLFVALLLFVWRVGFDFYLERFAPLESVLVVGTGTVAKMVAKEVRERERLGFKLVGFVGDEPETESREMEGAPILGGLSEISDVALRNSVRKIVVAITERRGGLPIDQLLERKVAGCRIIEWANFFEKLSGRIPVDSLAPSFFVFSDGFRKSWVLLFLRRLLSLVVALAALVLVAPVMLLVAALVKIDSKGPVFYTQERVGQYGKVFRIIKFRSMRTDAEADGMARWASKGDPRITRFGRFIRLTRLDELPQLINVLRGDIDLVGPRPERPSFVEELTRQIPFYSLRHTVKPGLTGWAQVMFTYCATLEESKDKLEYDLFYIKNMSVKLDLLIMFKTLKIVVLGRGAR